jgi:small subunit ribosomal protein S9
MENQINAIGRRKAAVARIYMSKGKGNITVNGKDYKTYFSLGYLHNQVEAPLKTLEEAKAFDITVNVNGGGIKGQAEAIKLGIARALVKVDENFKPALKHAGLLTRDARVVERKKPGLKKARKSFQFSKR